MRFQCNHCKSVLDIDDCEYGELVACGQCHAAVAVPAGPTASGALLGDFLIIKELGTGGMGKVYLAHQVSLARDVALKVLSADFAQDENFIKNFINEARMAAALNHPNIVQAYAVNSDAANYYFAMELIEGNTMKQVLQNSGRLVHEKVLSIAADIVTALAYAWQEKKLIHRDIKPDNIMLTYYGRTKLADMGLARRVTATSEAGSAELYGTPQYVAPELILGEPADIRSDIYSLGATLYHALSGNCPFQAADLNEMAMQHLSTALQPLQERVPDAPAPLARMVEIMLAKRPQHRYQNYEQLQADLARVQNGQMPVHVLADEAQMPVDMNLPDPMNLGPSSSAATQGQSAQEGQIDSKNPDSSTTAGLKLGHKSSKVLLAGKKATATGKGSLDLGTQSGTAKMTQSGKAVGLDAISSDGDSAAELEEPAAARKSKLGLVLGLLAAVLVIGGGAGAWFLLGRGEAASSGQSELDGTAGAGIVQSELLTGLQAKIQAKAPEPEIMADLTRIAYEVEAGTPDYDALLKLTAPYLEPVVQSARESLLNDLQAKWASRIQEFKEQKQRDDDEAQAQAEQARKEAEEAKERQRQEAEAQKRTEELELAKQAIRDTMALRANELDFSGARVPFAVMSQSSVEAEKDWATMWLTCIENAESLFLMLKNSKGKVAGVSFMLRNDKSMQQEWKVSNISYNTVRLKLVKSASDRRSKGKDEEQEKTYELDKLAEAQNNFVLLVQEALKAEGRIDEFDNLYGSFLLVRGDQTAKKYLEAAMTREAIMAEMPFLRSSYVKTQVSRLRSRTKTQALQYARFLKKNFSEEFAPYEEEAKAIIEGLAQ